MVLIDLEDTQVVVDLPSTGSKLSDAEWTTTVIYGMSNNVCTATGNEFLDLHNIEWCDWKELNRIWNHLICIC